MYHAHWAKLRQSKGVYRSKELASKTDVGEIRQLLENLLFANQDSIDRIRRRQMFDLDPPPAPPQVRIYRDYGRRIHTPSPPPPPTPPYRGRRRPPSPTRTIFHADLEKSQKGPNTDKVVPRSGPVRRVSSPGQHDQTKRDPNREIGSRTPKGSHSEPHHPSFVDWDSDKEEEVEHDQHEDRTDKVVDNLTSTAIVLRKRDETEHSTPPGQMQSKHEVKGPKPETRFLLSSGRSKTDVEPISNQKIKTNENGKEIEDSDESEYSESEGGSDVSSNSLHVLGGRSDDETLDKSTFMVNGKRNEGRGRVDPTDYWSWDRQQHSGHTRHRTDLTHGSRGDSPDDAATWLYRLVFLDDHRQGRPFNRSYSTRAIQLPEDEVPRTADRLLLQWTNAEPTTDNIEDHTSDVEAVMADPDPSWSRQLRTRISRITADEKQYTYRNPRDIHVNVSDSDASSDNPYAYNRNKCRHGRIKRDCAICKDPEPWDRDETFGSRRPRGRGSSLPRHAGAGENIHPGAVPHYQPDVPYAHYERTEQERAYQTHRNETLTKDIERLETTFRRTEALHAKEIAHRERMEMQLEKQYESNLKSIQDQMGTMKQDNYSMDSVQKRQLEFQLNHEHETRVKSLREQYETEIKQSAEVQAKLESHLRETLESLEKMKKVEAQEKKAEEEEKMYRAKREAEAEMQKKENAKPTRTCLQVSTLADRDQSWTPRFPSLGLSFSRLDGAPTRTSIHGTLCFTKPFLPSLSELYQVLKTHEWRPLWMRGSSGGKTWFLGRTPILVDFFRREYMPQVGKQHDQTGAPVYLSDTEDEYAAVGMGLIERDAIDELDLPYKGRVDGQHRFSVHLTYVCPLPFQDPISKIRTKSI